MREPGRPASPSTPPPPYPNRLKALRRAAGVSRRALGDALGMNENLLGRYERGLHEITLSMAITIGRQLRIDPRRLASGAAGIAAEVVGYVGDNGIVHPFPHAEIVRYEVPAGLNPDTTQGVVVEENAFYPMPNGLVLFYDRLERGDLRDAVGKLAIVRRNDITAPAVGRLRIEPSGRFSLQLNKPIFEDQPIVSASPIRAMMMPEQLVRLDDDARQQLEMSEASAMREAAEDPEEFTHFLGQSH